MQRIAAFLVTLSLLSLQGCATLFAGTPEVSMATNPTAAEVYVDGEYVGDTPLSLELDPKKVKSITFRADGYQDLTVPLNRKVGAGWVVLDILGGVLPVVVDAATGKWTSFEEDNVTATLKPVAADR